MLTGGGVDQSAGGLAAFDYTNDGDIIVLVTIGPGCITTWPEPG